ncbi:hypothetical protein HFD88_009058 [Aspergillus terreus]|nr:hypothetical protein HFD88_009058 [Aspergillus terreus]
MAHANALKAQQLEEVREQSLPASYCVEKSPLDRSERLPLTSPNVANANSNDNGLSVDTQPAFAFQPEWSANSGAFGYHAQVDTKEHPHMAMEIATSTFAVCPLQRLLAVEESAVDLYFPKEHFQVKIIEALDTATRFYECGKIFGVFPSDSTFLRQIDDAKILLFSLSFSDAV